MRLLLSAALLLPACAAAHHPAVAPVVAEAASATGPSAERGGVDAAAAVDAFHAALDRGDSAAALDLLVDDALIFEEGEAERSKAEYAGFHLGADIEFTKAVPSKLIGRTASSGGKMAFVASEYRTTGSWSGKAVDRNLTETMVLRRVGQQWLIAHIHWSSAQAH